MLTHIWNRVIHFAYDKLMYCSYCKKEQPFTDQGWYWKCTVCGNVVEKGK